MTADSMESNFYIGWDVGGWNCDKNPRSRDAIVILDSDLKIVGHPWRGNLRTTINSASTTAEWIGAIFKLCKSSVSSSAKTTLAIDAPLGFSSDLLRLATSLEFVSGHIENNSTNPYLFRQTERFLFQNDSTPLSAIKDMIGSQSTKGMHVLAKFANQFKDKGVWTDGELITVVETYPAACRGSTVIRELRSHAAQGHEDIEDALTCALVSYLFGTNKSILIAPYADVPKSEGWIWFPADALRS